MSDYQDWTPVVLRKDTSKKPTTQAGLAAAKAKGQVEVQKRDGHVPATVISARKLDDNEGADFKHQTVTLEFKLALQKARQQKGWTQKDLAQKINQHQTVIQAYENGTAIPQGNIINQLNRVLGVVLPKIPKKKVVKENPFEDD